MSMGRDSRSRFADWWWTVDRTALIVMLALFAVGLMLAFAASPAASGGPGASGNFHYALKQIAFAVVASLILGGASLLTPAQLRQVAVLVFAASLLGCLIVLFTGNEVLGARRWIDLGWMTLQPSEFLKPGFAVLAAAILADEAPQRLPKPVLASLAVAPVLVLLLLQPDVGQTLLMLALWASLLFFAGLPAVWLWAVGGGGAALAALAYLIFPHVHHRVAQFLDPAATGYQAGLALKAFAHGGLTGVGPGAGTIKYRLPDAHSDFIFAVAGEEFGFVLCGLIALLFCILTVRLLLRAAQARDPFEQLAGAGLAVAVALQAFINMGVAINMLPAKGMTLPFISYGGSSLFAVALTMGFALAATRKRPQIPVREARILAAKGAAP